MEGIIEFIKEALTLGLAAFWMTFCGALGYLTAVVLWSKIF